MAVLRNLHCAPYQKGNPAVSHRGISYLKMEKEQDTGSRCLFRTENHDSVTGQFYFAKNHIAAF